MVLSILPMERRATLRRVRRSSCHMQLERLEDRVVPSLADGTILIATGPSSFSTQDQASFPTGIIAVDPSTGTQSQVSTGGLFALPTYISEAPNQQLIVTDFQAFGTGALFRVDPNNGQQSLLTKGGFINGPNALVYRNGFIYVANVGDSSGLIHNIVQVNPTTGQQRLITDGSGGGFTVPVGLAPAPGNNIYVADEPGNVQGADPGAIWEVNLDTGKQTRLIHGGLLDHIVDIAVEANGDLIAGNTGSAANSYAGSVIRVNPQTGAQTLVSSFGADTGLNSLDLGVDGTIFVGAISNGPTPGKIYSVNPKTGGQSIVSSGGQISLVEGIRVFRTTLRTDTAGDTTTAVVSSGSPSVFGQTVTFTATISASSTQAGTPTGTVQFQIDGSNAGSPVSVSTSGGVTTTASFSTASLAVGMHTVTASYSGDSSFATSSGSLSGGQTVTKASTSTTVVSTANPSVSGQSVTFTATISSTAPGTGTPTGTVQFLIDGNNAGSPVNVSTSGGVTTASFNTASLAVATHTITASYGGDTNLAASSSTAVTQTVNKATTNTAMASSANPSTFGQGVTFTATVSTTAPGAGAPRGTVQFQIDSSNAGSPVSVSTTGGVTTASFSTTTLAVGGHSVTASYSGESSLASSTGTLPGGQTVNQANTSTVVVSSANPSMSGQSVTFTATVTVSSPDATAAVKPTGAVTFFDGATIIGQTTLSSAGGTTSASISTSGLAAGSHAITASYGGDSDRLTSTGGMIQTVNDVGGPVSTHTFLLVSALAVPLGQPIMLMAIVSSGPFSFEQMSGSVTFLDQGTPLATVPLSGPVATVITSDLSLGEHSLSATYSGDANHTASSSSVAAVTVGMSYELSIGQLYLNSLQRQPDAGGSAAGTADLNTFVTLQRAGGTLDQVSTILTSSPEYLQLRGGGTNDRFETALNGGALNRSPDSGGLAAYTKALNVGTSPRQVASGIVGSTENFRGLLANSSKEFLKRPADNGGLSSYVKAMRAGVLDQDNVAAAMLGSGEFLARA